MRLADCALRLTPRLEAEQIVAAADCVSYDRER